MNLVETERLARRIRAFQEEAGIVQPLEESLANGKVDSFIHILVGHLTAWDRKHGNPYSLGHLLGAKDEVRKDVASVLKQDDAGALGKLKASILRRFEKDFSPTKKTIKAIDKFLKDGKPPKYPVYKRG